MKTIRGHEHNKYNKHDEHNEHSKDNKHMNTINTINKTFINMQNMPDIHKRTKMHCLANNELHFQSIALSL